MTRNLTTAALNAVQAEVVDRTTAIALEFASGTVRMCGAPWSIFIDGDEFLGVGQLGSISTIEESAELQSYGLTIGLSGIPRDSVALALTQEYQGLPGTVWEVPLTAGGAAVADPIVIFRGRMDQLSIDLGETAMVTVKLQNRLTDWERPRVRRYTTEDQQRLHPGDRGFEFVSATVEREIVWPSRTALERRA